MKLNVPKPVVTFSKEEVEFIRDFADLCEEYDLDPWEAFGAISDKDSHIADVNFRYEN